MSRKTAPKPAKTRDPEEYKRFLEAARTAETSDKPEDFERAFKKVVKGKSAKRKD